VIGATPMKPMFSPIRPTEINEWMRENRDKVGVDQWVAIDDRDLVNEQGGRELVGHFVHTHPASGLTKRLADMAVEILSGGSPMATPGPGEATGFGKLSAALANTAPAVMGGAMAAAKGTFAGPGSPLRSKLSATPGGAAAAPSTLNAVRAVQAGAKSPIGAGGLLAAATSARTPTHGTPAPASPGTPGTKLTSKIRAASPPKRWSGTSPLALGAGGAD
jgi:HAD domain in Swiss Army Knife RNA repair proteins